MDEGAILITGAAGGMGLACTKRFVNRPRILCDVRGEGLTSLANGEDMIVAGDITDDGTIAAIASAVEEKGGLACAIHTAGLSPSMADARRIIEVNLVASARLADALLPLALPGSTLVMIASNAGYVPFAHDYSLLDDPYGPETLDKLSQGIDSGFAYVVSKHGVQRLVERLAPAWGARGARIVSISPGLIDTPMERQEMAAQPLMKGMLETAPIPRVGSPDDIASAAQFLCSPAAEFITGADLLVDGGVTAMRAQPQPQPGQA